MLLPPLLCREGQRGVSKRQRQKTAQPGSEAGIYVGFFFCACSSLRFVSFSFLFLLILRFFPRRLRAAGLVSFRETTALVGRVGRKTQSAEPCVCVRVRLVRRCPRWRLHDEARPALTGGEAVLRGVVIQGQVGAGPLVLCVRTGSSKEAGQDTRWKRKERWPREMFVRN